MLVGRRSGRILGLGIECDGMNVCIARRWRGCNIAIIVNMVADGVLEWPDKPIVQYMLDAKEPFLPAHAMQPLPNAVSFIKSRTITIRYTH